MFSITLQTTDTAITQGDVLGRLGYAASSETGADAILVSAIIKAVAEGDFDANNNPTSLVFCTASSEDADSAGSEHMRLTSLGRLGINTSSPSSKLEIAGEGSTTDDGIITVNDPSSGGTTSWIKLYADDGYDDLTWHISYADTSMFRDLEFRSSFSSVREVSISESGTLNVEANGTSTKRFKAYDFYSTTYNTAALPAYTFANDLDTGMWLASANNLCFSTAGTERLRIDSNGDVGINTTNPSEELHVVHPDGTNGVKISDPAGNGLLLGEGAYSAGSTYTGMTHTAYTASNEYMIISAGASTLVSSKATYPTYVRAGANATTYQAIVGVNQFAIGSYTYNKGANRANKLIVDAEGLMANRNIYIDRYLASNLAAGWYTVAINSGNRACGRFGLSCESGSRHQGIIFYASHHYGAGNQITILHNETYSTTNPIAKIRIKEGGTYNGCLLQVYIDDATNSPEVFLLGDNINYVGWVVTDWVADGTDPGTVDSNWSVGTFSGLTNVAKEVDLDTVEFGTTGNSEFQGSITCNTSAVFNESGGNNDFRVEGDTDTDLLFVDASTDRVGVSTNTPAQVFDITTYETEGLGVNFPQETAPSSVGGFQSLITESRSSSIITKHLENTSNGSSTLVLKNLIRYGTDFVSIDGAYTTGLSTTFDPKLFVNTDSGNVGIGTITPSEKLHVSGGDLLVDSNRPVTISTNGNIVTSKKASTGGWEFSHDALGSSGTNSGGYGWYGTDDVLSRYWIGPAYDTASFNILYSNGNVGINILNPTYPLDVSGTTRIEPTTSHGMLIGRGSGASSIRATGATAQSEYLILDSNGQYISLNHYTSDNIVMGYGNGNVGIATVSPTEKLHVHGGNIRSSALAGVGGGIGKADDGVHILYPGGGTFGGTSSSTSTGYIKIKLPAQSSATMLAFDLDIYEYESNVLGRVAKFRIAGYEYSNNQWHRTQVIMDGDGPSDHKYKVSFGEDTSGNKSIYISQYSDGKNGTDQTDSSIWRYVKVSVSNVFCGHGSVPYSEWIDNWDVGIVAASDIDTVYANHVVSRSLKLYESSYDLASLTINSAFTLPTSDGAANQVLTTDGIGAVTWQDGSGGSSSNLIRGSFAVTTSTSVFTVSGGYNTGSLDVYQNGVKLFKGSSYDFTETGGGTTFTLANAATNGDLIEYVALNASTSATGNTSLGSVSVTSNQTVFNTSDTFTSSNLAVFLNGVKLVDGTDYNVTSSSQFTLTSTAVSGDVVEYIAYGATVASSNLSKTGDTMTGNLTVNADLIVTGYKETHTDNGNTGTAQTIDISDSTLQTYTLTGNCTFTMPTADAGRSFTMFLKTGAGSLTATFTGVKFPSNTAPTITTDASRMDIITFYSDGTNWYGSIQQEYHV